MKKIVPPFVMLIGHVAFASDVDLCYEVGCVQGRDLLACVCLRVFASHDAGVLLFAALCGQSQVTTAELVETY